MGRLLANRWLRLAIGLGLLGGFFAFLTPVPRPPGAAGDVIDRNLEEDVQATALIYSDLEKMPELEARLRKLRERR